MTAREDEDCAGVKRVAVAGIGLLALMALISGGFLPALALFLLGASLMVPAAAVAPRAAAVV